MSTNRLRLDEYPIGVICALPVEKAAFVAMLDEKHDPLQTPKDDENSYTFGRIGNHNIVVACLPAGSTGNNSAATVAKDMLRSFPIKIGLMVGIGGGVWSHNIDIRLGDVVVSQPDGTHGGVVQWDFGKMEHDGFKRTGSLNKPPRPLLNAVQDIKEIHMMEGDELAENLSKLVQNKPKLARTFVYQGLENDCLYKATYNHSRGETCDGCAIENIISRQARTTTDPQVHYGNIASGIEVVKNGEFRDRVARDLGIICFEMEAAGLMDSFPCLVIRGICDYADSHKNKRWQPYAAAAAAAYAKELIGVLRKQGVDELKPAVSYQTNFSLDGVPRTRHFVDRPMEIEQLERVLIPGPRQNQRQKIQVLRGLGGMGKTQLAVEFARRHHTRFSAVFWLDGRSEDLLKRSIAKCASRISPGQISEKSRTYTAGGGSDMDAVVREVIDWLARPDNTHWLLIFDDVDQEYSSNGKDPDAYDVRSYFSGADRGSILITTRLARLEQLGDSHHLGKVSLAQGKAILESWYKQNCDDTEKNTLLELLDGLPLAIAQAGAYIYESGLDLTKYISFYKQQCNELIETDKLNDSPLQDYPNRSVWTTWAISFNTIREKHRHTANLLLLWSFLDNKDLWYDLLAAPSDEKYYGKCSSAPMLSRWIGNIASSEVQFSQAMQLLRNYSLVEEITGTSSYTTHPVVHQWARHSQGRFFEMELCKLAVVVVGWGMPYHTDSGAYALRRRLLPHAQVCFRHIVQREAFTQFEVDQGADEDNGHLGENETVLLGLTLLGDLYTNQRKWLEAEEINNRGLGGMKKVLGLSNGLTLGTMNNLGVIYARQERLPEAEEMFVQAIQGQKKLLGPTHPSTLRTARNLGNLYRVQGKLVEASEMCERVLGGQEEVLESTDMSILETMGCLGVIYATQGKLAKAEQMYDRTLLVCKANLGEEGMTEHAPAIQVLYNRGGLHVEQGNLAGAEQDYERALRGYEKMVGTEHVQEHTGALDVLWNLGVVFERQRESGKAIAVCERALHGYSDLYGPSSEKCRELTRWIEKLKKDHEKNER